MKKLVNLSYLLILTVRNQHEALGQKISDLSLLSSDYEKIAIIGILVTPNPMMGRAEFNIFFPICPHMEEQVENITNK